MDDATSYLSYFRENVPLWKLSLEEVAENVAKTRSEAANVAYLPKPDKDGEERGNNSTKTLRPTEDSVENPPTLVSNGFTPITSSSSVVIGEVTTSPLTPTSPFFPNMCKRKRSVSTLSSGHVAGVTRYRCKSSTVVHYDSGIQTDLEKVVGDIGNGRHMIRKSMKAARAAKLLKEEASDANRQKEDNEDDELNDASLVLAKLGYRSRNGTRGVRSIQVADDAAHKAQTPEMADEEQQFTLLNNILERAQDQCERGAHQLLRDGDCTEEIRRVQAMFQEVLEICERQSLGSKSTQTDNRVPATDNFAKAEAVCLPFERPKGMNLNYEHKVNNDHKSINSNSVVNKNNSGNSSFKRENASHITSATLVSAV